MIKGIVCKKNVAHRRMNSKIDKVRLLLLGGALEYQRVTNHLSSFDTLLQQVSTMTGLFIFLGFLFIIIMTQETTYITFFFFFKNSFMRKCLFSYHDYLTLLLDIFAVVVDAAGNGPFENGCCQN